MSGTAADQYSPDAGGFLQVNFKKRNQNDIFLCEISSKLSRQLLKPRYETLCFAFIYYKITFEGAALDFKGAMGSLHSLISSPELHLKLSSFSKCNQTHMDIHVLL